VNRHFTVRRAIDGGARWSVKRFQGPGQFIHTARLIISLVINPVLTTTYQSGMTLGKPKMLGCLEERAYELASLLIFFQTDPKAVMIKLSLYQQQAQPLIKASPLGGG